MSRGRGGSLMPIFGLIILSLVFVIGVIIFGVSMQSAYVESNYTAEYTTLLPYELNVAWFTGAAILAMVIAMGFAFWYFWG